MPKNPSGFGERPQRWGDRWRARLTIGYDARGKQIQKAVYGNTQQECLEKLEALKRKRDDGLVSLESSVTIARYLQHWLEVKAKEVSPRTIRIYRNEVDHILPYLGRLQLDKLTPMQVQKMQLEIADKTSARMAKATRGLLRNALNDAVRMGLVVRNVADLVKPVRYLRPKFQIWNAEEVVRFLQFARTHWYHPLFYTALSTGLRIGELIALEWPDIHEDALHVQRTFKTGAHGPEAGPPKTRQSNRVIKLPRDLLQMLAEHQSNLHRLELGDGLVFPSRAGHFLNPSNVRRSLHAISRKADVKIVRPHDLRHTHAAMCIANGMDVMRLAVRLGHADPGFTLRRYGHIFERYRPDEAPSMDELTGVSEASKVNSKVNSAIRPN